MYRRNPTMLVTQPSTRDRVSGGSDFVVPVRRLAKNGFEAWTEAHAESYVLGSGNESFRDNLPDQWSSHAFQVRGNGRLFHEK